MSESVGYRCTHCGNKTRFDVYDTVRRRRFEHSSLGGEVTIDEEDILSRTVDRIVCRWCDRDDGIEVLSRQVVDRRAAQPGQDRGDGVL